MTHLPASVRVYLCVTVCDMRKSCNASVCARPGRCPRASISVIEAEGGARFLLAGQRCRSEAGHCRGAEARIEAGWARSGAQVIKSLPAPTPIRQEDRADTYLLALGALCLELARAPQLLPVFLRVIKLAPRPSRRGGGGGVRRSVRQNVKSQLALHNFPNRRQENYCAATS